LKKLFTIAAILMAIMMSGISFIFAGSEQENIFYIGCGFGLAALLLFMVAVRSKTVKPAKIDEPLQPQGDLK
jgi:hypothetical protein